MNQEKSQSLDKDRIAELIGEYNSKDYPGLAWLMLTQKELSSQFYHLCTSLSSVTKRYWIAYMKRRSYEQLEVNKSDAKSIAAAKAEVQGRDEYIKLYQSEKTLLGQKEAGELFKKGVQEVLFGMRQEISDLKQEKKDAMNNTGAYT